MVRVARFKIIAAVGPEAGFRVPCRVRADELVVGEQGRPGGFRDQPHVKAAAGVGAGIQVADEELFGVQIRLDIFFEQGVLLGGDGLIDFAPPHFVGAAGLLDDELVVGRAPGEG
jgi:hypothetical protein